VKNIMQRIIVVGGGAAGLMAAYSAAKNGGTATVLEKMPDIGRKILITGKGRCNITNSADIKTIIKNIPGNGAFLYSALSAFDNNDVVSFMNEYGVKTKVERGNRVFPVSDKARDVVAAFAKALARVGATVITGTTVKKIRVAENKVVGVVTEKGHEYNADAIIVATGGASYPGTGSSGDGYRIAKELGHTVTSLKPSLVPLEVAEEWVQDLQGLSLRNITASVIFEGKKVAEEFGEMLFTHYGLSGPIILSLSKKVAELLNNHNKEVMVSINLKPALSLEILDQRIQRDFEKFSRKQFKNALSDLLPAKLIETFIDLSFIDPEKPVNQITKKERQRMIELLTDLRLTITKTRPISEAIVTAGGVNIKEINPKTMESKLINGLYFAGEVIDIDGFTGGYNLQAAFATGYVAGYQSVLSRQ
jgi:predicted Rossmann fold flavoprotein